MWTKGLGPRRTLHLTLPRFFGLSVELTLSQKILWTTRTAIRRYMYARSPVMKPQTPSSSHSSLPSTLIYQRCLTSAPLAAHADKIECFILLSVFKARWRAESDTGIGIIRRRRWLNKTVTPKARQGGKKQVNLDAEKMLLVDLTCHR